MRFHRRLAWVIGLMLLAIAPAPVEGQGPRRPSPRLLSYANLRTAPSLPYQAQPSRSLTRTVLTHTLVGTGAGLLTGMILSGTDVSEDDASVVLVWTSVGAFAGVVSGVLTWLLEDIE